MDAERDVYEELLTQAEIQGNVNKVNRKLLVNLLFMPILVVLTPAIHPDTVLFCFSVQFPGFSGAGTI